MDQDGNYNHDNNLYDIEIQNNLPSDKTSMFNSLQSCDFCGKDHSDNCLFSFPDDRTLGSVLSKIKYDRNLEITINWKRSPDLCNFQILEPENFTEVSLNNPGNKIWMNDKNNISIYDCLSSFSQEEMLTGDDKWYCNKCKEHTNALKKIEVYKTPEYLIIHFKRFAHHRGMFGGGGSKITD